MAHLAGVGLLAASLPAAAQVTFDVIGPHEYDLPVDFKPFNVFVQYADFQRTTEVWNSGGDKKNSPDTDLTVGLSKYVHFWTPESNRNIGLATELCPPAGIQTRDVPFIPKDRCPPKEPCAYPPTQPDEQPGVSGPGAMGWSLPSSALPQLHDGTPSPLFAADYGGDSLRHAQSLDSPFLDVTTGELSLEEVDFLLPGSGLDFHLTRSYHSFLV